MNSTDKNDIGPDTRGQIVMEIVAFASYRNYSGMMAFASIGELLRYAETFPGRVVFECVQPQRSAYSALGDPAIMGQRS